MTNLTVSNNSTDSNSHFDSIRHTCENGIEFWLARELMSMLGYPRWNEFIRAIERAEISCKTLKGSSNIHFRVITEMVKLPQGGFKRRIEYQLTRYACYLVAMNGDPRKSEVASAQSYFAAKTREAEVVIPAQSEKIRELELEVQLAQIKKDLMNAQDVRIAVLGLPVTLLLEGKGDTVVEVENKTIEIIDDRNNTVYKGKTLKQVADSLGSRSLHRFKSGTELKRYLEKKGLGHLIAQTPRTVIGDYIPEENIEEVYRAIE